MKRGEWILWERKKELIAARDVSEMMRLLEKNIWFQGSDRGEERTEEERRGEERRGEEKRREERNDNRVHLERRYISLFKRGSSCSNIFICR